MSARFSIGSFVTVSIDAPVASRSTQGEKQTPAAGNGTPRLRRATSVAIVSPPPAESPAIASRVGDRPDASSHR
jgi:hypothetical protein